MISPTATTELRDLRTIAPQRGQALAVSAIMPPQVRPKSSGSYWPAYSPVPVRDSGARDRIQFLAGRAKVIRNYADPITPRAPHAATMRVVDPNGRGSSGD